MLMRNAIRAEPWRGAWRGGAAEKSEEKRLLKDTARRRYKNAHPFTIGDARGVAVMRLQP